jgi:hypothetical protein
MKPKSDSSKVDLHIAKKDFDAVNRKWGNAGLRLRATTSYYDASGEPAMAAVWWRDNIRVEGRHFLSSVEEDKSINDLSQQGLYPICFDVCSKGVERQSTVLVTPSNGLRWLRETTKTPEILERLHVDRANKGRHMTFLGIEIVAGRPEYRALFVENGLKNSGYSISLTRDEFIKSIKTMPKSRQVTSINAYEDSGTTRYALTWAEGNGVLPSEVSSFEMAIPDAVVAEKWIRKNQPKNMVPSMISIWHKPIE